MSVDIGRSGKPSLLSRPAPPAQTARPGDRDRAYPQGDPGQRAQQASTTRPHPGATAGISLFALLVILYLGLGVLLIADHDAMMEDTMARLSAASSVWSAREPKVAALGFVWTPLPALAMAVLTPLRPLWPQLVSQGYIAVFVSAVAAATSVCVVRSILIDLRLHRHVRWALTALFAVQPLIIVYAGNGMTETMLLAFLLIAVQRLLRWVEQPDVAHLIGAGIAFALAYLTRYEAIVAAAAATVLVIVVTTVRTSGAHRRSAAAIDGMLVGLAPAVAAIGWAVLSWSVVGSPFEQFTSPAGNSALIQAAGIGSSGFTALAEQLVALAPTAVPALAVATVSAWRHRDARLLVPVAVLGSTLACTWVLLLTGGLFGFLRYQIAAVPLSVLLIALLVRTWRPAVGVMVAVLALGGAFLTSASMIVGENALASQEYPRVRLAVALPTPTTVDGLWTGDRLMAARLDALHLPAGSVLADTRSAFAVVAASDDPAQFVIPSDSDFSGALTDPTTHDIRYILRSENERVDAVRATWPNLSDVDWARQVDMIAPAVAGSHAWTLWEVSSSTRRR